VIASEPATEQIREHGGRLYVWLQRPHCCGAVTRLAAANEPPARKEFRQVESDTPFELYLPAGLTRLPDELHLDVRGRRRRVEAYWNGCSWVV
jgi:hypothetical protein